MYNNLDDIGLRIIAQTYSAKVTLDVRGLPWLDDYHAALAKCLKMLEDIFYKLETSINLIVLGLPLLTQFNVGLVFFLARHFCRVSPFSFMVTSKLLIHPSNRGVYVDFSTPGNIEKTGLSRFGMAKNALSIVLAPYLFISIKIMPKILFCC